VRVCWLGSRLSGGRRAGLGLEMERGAVLLPTCMSLD